MADPHRKFLGKARAALTQFPLRRLVLVACQGKDSPFRDVTVGLFGPPRYGSVQTSRLRFQCTSGAPEAKLP